MATLLYRLGKTAYRRWPIFLAAWLIALVGVVSFTAAFSKPMTDAMTIPGIPSEKAADLQSELFPGATDAFDDASFKVIVQAPEGHTLDEPEYSKAIDALVLELAELPQTSDNVAPVVVPDGGSLGDQEYAAAVGQVRDAAADAEPDPEALVISNPVITAQLQEDQISELSESFGFDEAVAAENAATFSTLSTDRTVGIITSEFDVETPMDIKPASQDAVHDAMDTARDAGLTVEANGSGMADMGMPGGTAELLGIGVALLILILTFGSLVAAGLPIVTAIFGVALGLVGVTGMTAFTDISSSTSTLAMMLGLAVGIDYALFILARYRNELEHTDDREEAVGVAVGTAGSAVVFAGLTVLIALCALAVVQIPFLTSMGLAAAATVFIAVLIALTLLPAVLGMVKTKAFAGRVRKASPKRDEKGKLLNNGVRWARLIGKRPVAALILVVVALGALAIPIKDMHLAFPTDSTSPSETTQRKASDILSESFGPGQEAQMMVVVDARDIDDVDARTDRIAEVATWAGGIDGMVNAQVAAPATDDDGNITGAIVIGTPETGPDDKATEDILADVRDGQAGIEEATGTAIGATGLTAITVDVSERLADALPIYLAVVIGLAFILLMIVFRSILVPLTATLGFLLSVLATLGATVAIFQEGAFGFFEGQPIVSFMPLFLIGVVFGLAMDYQVFLVTRIREAHVHGASPSEAVIDGFRGSARVVTAAAAIMTAVFSAFMLEDAAIIQMMGFALASAIVFDALIVRMTMIPALMYLMGEKAWYLPKWLDKILPNVDIEGENLHRPHMDTLHRDDHDQQPVGV